MEQEGKNEALLRKYLLGQLNEADEQALEEELLADDELSELLLAEEDELVDDYLGRELSEGERERFDNHFMVTPDREGRLKFGEALSRYTPVPNPVPNPNPARDPNPATDPNPAPDPNLAPALKRVRPRWWSKAFATPYLRWATATVIILAVGLGTWRAYQYIRPPQGSRGMLALNQAFLRQRPTESRVTGLIYAPPPPTTRGPERDKFDYVALDRARALIQLEANEHPSARSYHDLGRLYLAEHEYDKAIDQLEKALKLDEKDAQLHSDCGAALLESGLSVTADKDGARKIEAFARSIEHLNRALALDPKLRDALFDRALLHEHMMLVERAIEGWRAYLEQDPNSPWADEAREHLKRLEEGQRRSVQSQQNVVEEFLNACGVGDEERVWALYGPNREKIISDMLATYLGNTSRGTDDLGAKALAGLAYVGELDVQRTGDRYTADTVHFYQSASAQSLLMARQARELMSRARDLYTQGQVEEAAESRDHARQIFARIGDVCGARLATYWLALHWWELGRTQQSQSLLDALVSRCETAQYHWLYMRALYQCASIAIKLDEYSKAIAYYQEVQERARKLNDPLSAVDASSGLIEHYRVLGNRQECLEHINASWPLLAPSTLNYLPFWRHYNLQAMAFNTFGFPDAAIDCARESLRYAVAANNFTMLSFSYAHLGLMYGKAQKFEEAFGYIRQAYEIPEAHADKSLGRLMMAYASVQMGHLHRERGEFAEALDQYDQSIELHRRYALDFSTHLYQAYKGRLACCMALNDTSAAQRQLVMLLGLMDKNRAKIVEEENRDSFFDVEQNVYDMGIDLAYSRMQDWQKSFAYAELSRGRSLLDSMSAGSQVVKRGGKVDVRLKAVAQPLSLTAIQERIPDQARLLEYAVLDDKLIVWVISRDNLQPVAMPVSQAALSETVKRFLEALKGASDAELAETARLSRELFGELLSPVEPLLDGCHTLVIIPDKVLNLVPWDALVCPVSNKFLLEDYLVTVAPSATLFAVCTDLAARKAGRRDERLLSIGDPLFDDQAFPQLRSLEGAENEAKKICTYYSASSRLLVGPAADEPSVRDELPNTDVAHFALHCVINQRSAMRSALVLAKESGSGGDSSAKDGLLQAYEICGLKLARVRLAVLSACQTGVEQYHRGEGMIGMARAFLVARAPLVVASMWPVDSGATAELMIRFHEYRKLEGLPTNEALRRAKRDLLQGPVERYRRPVFWAAFQTIGGHASF